VRARAQPPQGPELLQWQVPQPVQERPARLQPVPQRLPPVRETLRLAHPP
jgi:hypothetical protein